MLLNKRTSRNILSWAFFAVASLDIIAVGLRLPAMETIFKPLILLSLMLLYFMSSEKRNGFYLAALIFSFLGDVFLLDKKDFFLFGVGSFLIAQLLFIVVVRKNPPQLTWRSFWLAALPFLIYLILLMSLLFPSLGEMRTPVLVYGIVISLFGITALQAHVLRRDAASRTLLIGVVLFILSDSMIAINKFLEPHMVYPVAIMLTYVLAQYLIYSYVISIEQEEIATDRR